MAKKTDGAHLQKYWPLFSLILIAAAAAYALISGTNGRFGEWMHYFMGMFFCQFALLKIFNPSKFADGFQMYDLLAKYSRTYALGYPLIELGLGLAYLSFAAPLATYLATILVMSLGSAGVLLALKRGLDVKCACMGSVLDVPLSTVTLTEDIGMSLMALAMLFGYFF